MIEDDSALKASVRNFWGQASCGESLYLAGHDGEDFARLIWPRRLIRMLFPKHGLFLLVEGFKPKAAR